MWSIRDSRQAFLSFHAENDALCLKKSVFPGAVPKHASNIAFSRRGAHPLEFIETPPGASLGGDTHLVDPIGIFLQGGKDIAVDMVVIFHGLENIKRLGKGHAFSVGPVFRKRGEDIRHCHDAGGQGKLIACKAERIAFAVQALMV